jgi:hypothetical protein
VRLACSTACARCAPPFSPSVVVAEFARTLKSYRVSRVTSDRYAGLWPTKAFAKHNIRVEPAERSKSQIYVDALPLLNSRRAALVDNPRLVAQLCHSSECQE